ncbi:hypothetical protein EJB05_33973 [Eragrostis curvula]|uniref:Agenet domain-containing protein n=1 Tax=Eragrostis curvula TaxID=38414 RepID=A0A5J9U483_9POAL|nr:hypothetical protein EJB05_33973 [Eragrostis curvula]
MVKVRECRTPTRRRRRGPTLVAGRGKDAAVAGDRPWSAGQALDRRPPGPFLKMDLVLPYKVGDLAECKTFQEGYRGAWFRCKINGMRVKESGDSGHYECYLEYIDYPDEDQEWVRLFQKNPPCSKQPSRDDIMIRPSFPQWHWKDQVPEELPDNDIIATVDETWKIGDLVDWFSQDCYWSGKITKLFSEKMVEVELLEPPIGEGKVYAANRDDLRPTLNWCLSGGWTVPLSQDEHTKPANGEEPDTSDSSEDESDAGDDGSDDGDNQDVQLPVSSSETSQEASGSPIPNPSSDARSMSSLNALKDVVLMALQDLRASSSSNPPAPHQGAQQAVTSNKPGARIVEQEPVLGNSEQGSSPPEHEAGDVQDQDLQKVDKTRALAKKLVFSLRVSKD